jgi:hypothetical protein
LNEILHEQGRRRCWRAVGKDVKGKASLDRKIAAIHSHSSAVVADAIYASVAMIWLVPDPRIERKLRD